MRSRITISSRASCPADHSSASPSVHHNGKLIRLARGRLMVTVGVEIELEDVDHLVTDRVPKLGEVPLEGQRHSALEEIRRAKQALRVGCTAGCSSARSPCATRIR